MHLRIIYLSFSPPLPWLLFTCIRGAWHEFYLDLVFFFMHVFVCILLLKEYINQKKDYFLHFICVIFFVSDHLDPVLRFSLLGLLKNSFYLL